MRMSSGILLTLAALGMLIALICETVTLAGQDYRTLLLIAVAAMGIADFLCGVVFLRAGRARWLAFMIALPSLFIAWDFLRRAPYVWGFA